MREAYAMLSEAAARGRCLPAFNIYNLESMQAGLAAARTENLPLMLAFGAAYRKHMSFRTARAMLNSLLEAGDRVILHLDHCPDPAALREAADAGFDSVMIDGSALPYEENLRLTAEAAAYAHAKGIPAEGELGGLNDEHGGGSAAELVFTDPEQAADFVRRTGVDTLAVSVGNAHGLYKGEPHIDLERLELIREKAGVPLVLHGCSGIPAETIRAAAQRGVVKINVNTELALTAARAARELLNGEKQPVRYNQAALAARDAMIPVMREFLALSR